MTNGWRARWIGWRNRLLADARFQRFAARFPLTRPIARRRARALFDLVAGFTYSQTLAAVVEAGVIDLLADSSRSTVEVAAATDLPADGAERLLRAAAAIDLVESVGDRWMLGSAGAALRGNRGIAEMIAHHPLLYADLADPIALLRRGGGGGQLQRYWHYAGAAGTGTADRVAAYSSLMTASQPLVAEQVIDSYRFARHRRMLDVGGGEGAFVTAVARRVPQLAVALLDLPAVAVRAQARLARDRVCADVISGNFLTDSIPAGFDLVTLVRVLHDHDDMPSLNLLRSIREALVPGGRILIAEPMAGTSGAEPAGDAYFGTYLLAMGSGRPRTAAEIRGMLEAAGFRRSRIIHTAIPLSVRVIVATT